MSDTRSSGPVPDAALLPVSLYAHVPFCRAKCAYCDFCSIPATPADHRPLVDALLAEAQAWSVHGVLDDVATVYIGGGTPTLLGTEAVRLVRGLLGHAPHAGEVTIEANPESLTPALAEELAFAGVTRFSLGIQSFDDRVLSTLGRCHDAAEARAAARILADLDVPFSVDLICGVPGQSMRSWLDTVVDAIGTAPAHVSVYPLTIEDETPLAQRIASGDLTEPDPDVAADQMEAAEELLESAGLLRYEVANYALLEHESKHNTGYWTGRPYVGLGPSAASMLPADVYQRVAGPNRWALCPETADRVRFTRTRDVAAYRDKPFAAPAERECLTSEAAAREDIMLGMRLRVGVLEARIEAAGLLDVIWLLARDGLVSYVAAYRAKPFAAPAERECLMSEAAAREDIMLGMRLRVGVLEARIEAAGLLDVIWLLARDGLVSSADGDDGRRRWMPTHLGWLLGNEVFSRLWAGE